MAFGKESQKRVQNKLPTMSESDHFWVPFGDPFGHLLGVRWVPIAFLCSDRLLESILEPFGVDFGSALGFKIEFESVPNLRKLKCSKCYYLKADASAADLFLI